MLNGTPLPVLANVHPRRIGDATDSGHRHYERTNRHGAKHWVKIPKHQQDNPADRTPRRHHGRQPQQRLQGELWAGHGRLAVH
jgi:hypothetical protein